MGARIPESFGSDRNFCTRMNPSKGKLLTNTVYYTGMSFIRNGLSFLTLPILTSFLTPEDYGIVGLVTTISGFGSIFFGGVNAACYRFYFKYHGRHPHPDGSGRLGLGLRHRGTLERRVRWLARIQVRQPLRSTAARSHGADGNFR